ncbi:hypothetical protein O3P69_004332 [Scylla paramamosain]|uniref:Reverse transcriptase domain-containing protein n=1 Tax=Scylla paramamosain TaxID=85552 RepID=A0AAW0UBM0_SCYPA
MLAAYFLWKMSVLDPGCPPHAMTRLTNATLSNIEVTADETLEAIIVSKVTSFFDLHCFSIRQFGFHSNMSANDPLLHMSTSWHQSLDRGCDIFISLDTVGDFDRVWHSALIAKLHNMGMSGGLLHLLQYYLWDKSLCMVADLAQDKTQVMLVFQRRSYPASPIPTILLDRKVLPLQPAVRILAVKVNSNFSFTSHVKKTASKAPSRLNCVRRVAHLDT